MKTVYTHAVAAGGACLPVEVRPSRIDWDEIAADLMRETLKTLPEYLQKLFLNTFEAAPEYAIGGILMPHGGKIARLADLTKPRTIRYAGKKL